MRFLRKGDGEVEKPSVELLLGEARTGVEQAQRALAGDSPEGSAGSTGIEGFGEGRYGPTPHQGPTPHLVTPNPYVGATGPARAYLLVDRPDGLGYSGATGASCPGSFYFEEGEIYAFRIDGREFFATGRVDGTTGFLELEEVNNPYTGKPMPGELRALTADESDRLADSGILEGF